MTATNVRGGQVLDNSIVLTPGVGQDITGILPAANGGTGNNTNLLNAVLLGNGTGALQTVAPSSSGNVLQSNGTTWQSVAPVVANFFSIDGGSASTVFAGTLKIDFGGAA